MKLTVLIVLALLAVADNQTGQSKWCWVSAHGTTEFCNYSSYSACREQNKGDGTCFKR